MEFKIVSPFSPTGDQPEAIAELTHGIKEGLPAQTLLGVTGSGKTFTMANVIEQVQKPTLILSHNKTLAAQLYSEFKNFSPKCCRIFCFLLRLLSTRGLYSDHRYLYRKRSGHQRRDRSVAVVGYIFAFVRP